MGLLVVLTISLVSIGPGYLLLIYVGNMIGRIFHYSIKCMSIFFNHYKQLEEYPLNPVNILLCISCLICILVMLFILIYLFAYRYIFFSISF